MGLLGTTWMQVFTRACGVDVSFRDIKIKIPDWGNVNDVMRRIWGDLKKLVELRTRHRTRSVDFRGSQRPDEFARYGFHTRWGGVRWKSQNRKNVYLSPYVEKPLNSKAIKSFVPELKSRECFSCFGIPMFYVYMSWTFFVRFTHIRIWRW